MDTASLTAILDAMRAKLERDSQALKELESRLVALEKEATGYAVPADAASGDCDAASLALHARHDRWRRERLAEIGTRIAALKTERAVVEDRAARTFGEVRAVEHVIETQKR